MDRVERLMADPEERHRMGENALRRVHETFTWSKAAETFINILRKEQLLDGDS